MLETSKKPEKVLEWFYTIPIGQFNDLKEDVEKIEISMLKCLMLKYKEKLIE